MIATTLHGGLGNQMFIYAMVRALALRNKTDMAFNTWLGFTTDYKFRRTLELTHLNVTLPEAGAATFDVPLGRLWRKLSQKVGRNVLLPKYRMVRDCAENRHMELVSQPADNVYLEGYWQSERYFKDFEKEIRDEFRIKTPMPQRTLDELKEIEALGENTVLIGVRRYQECGATQMMDVLPKEYYDKCIDIMRQRVKDPVFVVFCQDYEWAKKNIRIDGAPVHYVRPKDGQLATIEDMWLMNRLRHFIISNSSFYWWGAWLATGDDKIVLAPTNFSHPYAVPDKWEKVNYEH